ncbi:MAG TPA: tyrosine-type recombinase/integrase [Ktedonobacteraceae bacterium]
MAKNVRKIKKREESDGFLVQEVIQEYLVSPHVKNLSPRTQQEYQQELGVFSDWCQFRQILNEKGNRRADSGDGLMLHQIDQYAVQLFLEHLQATHKPTKKSKQEISTYTLAGYVRVIKSFLNWCVLDDQYGQYTSSVIIQRIENPKVIEVIIETFSPEQIQSLFKSCEKEESEHLQLRDKAIIAVLLDCGLRATELCTLTIGNISLDVNDAYVRVLGKGNKWGEVGLGDQARKYVQKYIRMFREPTIEYEVQQKQKKLSDRQRKQIALEVAKESLVFVNRCGDPLTKTGLWRILDRLGAWAHIEGVRCSPHTLRHTFAKMFMQNGGDIYTLSKLLRHASVSITETYLKSLQQSEARRGAKSVLDNI